MWDEVSPETVTGQRFPIPIGLGWQAGLFCKPEGAMEVQTLTLHLSLSSFVSLSTVTSTLWLSFTELHLLIDVTETEVH